MKKTTLKLTESALFLALSLLLPLLTMQNPQLGNALSPMHIPVLLCGFVCGWPYGLAVGLIAPPLRFLLFGMPPIFPTGTAMAFELAAYGAIAGLLYKYLPNKIISVYIALIASMLAGRAVWGAAMYILSLISVKVDFTFAAFLAGAFVKAVPGIILHIVLVPLIVIALRKAKLIANE